MTPEQVKAIRDQVGGIRAMAERLEITERAARLLVQKGAKRKSTVNRIRRLAEPGTPCES